MKFCIFRSLDWVCSFCGWKVMAKKTVLFFWPDL